MAEDLKEAGGGTPAMCQAPGCAKEAIVLAHGRALCAHHYLSDLNELNDLGLTPRGLSERAEAGQPPPEERRMRQPVEGPRQQPSRELNQP